MQDDSAAGQGAAGQEGGAEFARLFRAGRVQGNFILNLV
jgi:hypothetical protein